MAEAIWTAASGGIAQQEAMRTRVHDLANVNTTGYKGTFAVLIEAKAPASSAGTNATNLHTGILEEVPDWTQGALVTTDSPLDVAIDGPGFFVVRTPEGNRLTRNGSFALAADGILRTSSGLVVEGESGPILIAQDEAATLDADGVVLSAGRPIDRLRMVEVPDRAKLVREGEGLWDATGASPFLVEAQLKVGHLEASNVSPILATVQMVDQHRAFESYMTTMRMANEVEKKLVNEVK